MGKLLCWLMLMSTICIPLRFGNACQQIIFNWHSIHMASFENGWMFMHISCGCPLIVFSTGCIVGGEPSPDCGHRFTHPVDCYASTELQRLPTMSGQYSTTSISHSLMFRQWTSICTFGNLSCEHRSHNCICDSYEWHRSTLHRSIVYKL